MTEDHNGGSGRVDYRSTAKDIFEAMPGDFESLRRKWRIVTGDRNAVGARSGGWVVREEHEGDRLGPPFHEIAVYVERNRHRREVGRWSLDDLPDDPVAQIRQRLQEADDAE